MRFVTGMSKSDLAREVFNPSTFVPYESDKRWLADVLNTIKDGGVWAVPVLLGFYTVDHTNKTLWLEEGDESAEVHLRTRIVSRAIGWECKPR